MSKDNRDIGLIVLVDHLTKHAWVETIQNKESSNVARFLEDVFVDIGLKEMGEGDQALYEMNVRSDNGGEFIAAAVAEMCKKYGVNKKEGPSYSPWVQGAVERLNQTLKRKLVALMSANNTQRWSQFVPQVVSEYNNAFHSTIKMKPIVAWRICWCSDPSSEPLANKMQRLGHIDIIRKCIRARGEAAREHYLRKNPNIPRFKVGDIVRVRVPQKYRSSRCYLFGRKGVIVDEQLGDDGLSLYRYKVKWLESGGIKPSQKPGDISPYIEARDLKTFYLGNNVFVEPATMDVDDDGEVIYDEDDEHPVPPPVSHPPMLPPVLPPVSPPPVDAPPVSPQVINDGTLVISRKNKNKKRRRKPDSEEERVHKAAKHA